MLMLRGGDRYGSRNALIHTVPQHLMPHSYILWFNGFHILITLLKVLSQLCVLHKLVIKYLYLITEDLNATIEQYN